MYWQIAICIMLLVWMFWHKVEVKKKMRNEEKTEEKFWEREAEANSVRRKPIDALDYVRLPKNLPVDLMSDNPEIIEIKKVLENLKDSKILNLTGYSNTDIKMEYGTANITELSKYDDNYTTLVTSLQKWADILWDAGYEEEAVQIMEYLVDTGADIGKTYRLLGKYYITSFKDEKYEELIKKAENLRSLNKPYIVQSIQDLK